jgi:hypothetical protein
VDIVYITLNQMRELFATVSLWVQETREWCARPGKREIRGRQLLREWLSLEQLKQYEEHNWFEVTGCHTRNKYRISTGTQRNVYELDLDGRPRVGWCFMPSISLVTGDVMLAQKIALETDEHGALAVANRFRLNSFEQGS